MRWLVFTEPWCAGWFLSNHGVRCFTCLSSIRPDGKSDWIVFAISAECLPCHSETPFEFASIKLISLRDSRRGESASRGEKENKIGPLTFKGLTTTTTPASVQFFALKFPPFVKKRGEKSKYLKMGDIITFEKVQKSF